MAERCLVGTLYSTVSNDEEAGAPKIVSISTNHASNTRSQSDTTDWVKGVWIGGARGITNGQKNFYFRTARHAEQWECLAAYGLRANYSVQPESKRHKMAWAIPSDNHMGIGFITAAIVLLLVDFLCVLVRLYAGYLQKRRPDLSDYTLICGFVLTAGSVVIMWASYSHGVGLDQSRFTVADVEMAGRAGSPDHPFPHLRPYSNVHQLTAPVSIVWFGSTTAIRISMTLFYRKLFRPVKSFMRVSAAVIAANALIYVTATSAFLAISHHMRYAGFLVRPGHWGNLLAVQTFASISSIVLDAITVALPMPLVWMLATSRQRKWGLSVIFGLGILICIVTTLRLVISHHYETDNSTIQTALALFLAGLESTLGIINACMPSFPPVIAYTRQQYASKISRLDRRSWRRNWRRSGPTTRGEDSPGDRPSHDVENGYTAAIMADPPSSDSPRYPCPVASWAPLRSGSGSKSGGGNAKGKSQSPRRESADGLDMPSAAATDSGSKLGPDVDGAGPRHAAASGPTASVAGQGRIYITRGFGIQSHSRKDSVVSCGLE
ncbi:hypothetical protein BJY00DRAFT_314561 [Aspergillus carlsbadensis]|nr:hypothetical protein BJY00DRAFT_314561 [Aspergillus carlsbadensis]